MQSDETVASYKVPKQTLIVCAGCVMLFEREKIIQRHSSTSTFHAMYRLYQD